MYSGAIYASRTTKCCKGFSLNVNFRLCYDYSKEQVVFFMFRGTWQDAVIVYISKCNEIILEWFTNHLIFNS